MLSPGALRACSLWSSSPCVPMLCRETQERDMVDVHAPDVCAARSRTSNSAIVKPVSHPPVLRGRNHRARGRNPAHRFKLADVSYSTFRGQTKRTEVM